MRKFFQEFIWIIFLVSGIVYSQDQKLDSLTNLLTKAPEDSNKVNILLNISDAYRSTNTALCLDYSEKAITLATTLKYETGMMRGYFRKAIALSKSGDNEGALKELSKGEKLLSTGKFSKHLPEFVMRKGYIEWGNKENDKAIKTFIRADSIYRAFKNDKGFGDLSVMGSVECWHVIARIYASKGEYVKAVESCNRSIDIAEKNKSWSSGGDAYSVLGGIFLQQHNYDRALECYKKSLEYSKLGGNARMVVGGYLSIGNCYFYKHEYDKAKESYLECLAMEEKMNDDLGTAYILANIGEIELGKKNWSEAIKYFERGLVLAEKLKDPKLLLGSYLSLSSAEIGLKKYDLALENAQRAMTLAHTLDDKQKLYELSDALSQIYFAKSKFKEAYLYRDSSAVLKDILTGEQNTKLSVELQEKYQNEKKENEIKMQKLDLQMKDSEIASSKKQKMIIVSVLIMVIIFLLILFNRFKITNKQKRIISEQKSEVEKQKNELQEKQKEIFDSLQYAKQIQKLLLANHKLVNETLPDSFVMFKPKDIVSGDFYWAAKKEDRFYLAVCDSTGHGVPGAFMSLLNINFLNEAVIEKNIADPNEIFNYVRKRLIDNISREGRQDGMDGILICVNEKTKVITYAAANNAPVIISNKVLTVADADKMPIGKGEKNEPFKLYSLQLKKNDMIILYTDGYADQFGGPKGKKFKYKSLNDILLRNHELPVLEQEEYLYAEFDNWKGSLEQVDDVCILGIRL